MGKPVIEVQWFRDKVIAEPNFLDNVSFSDEALFSWLTDGPLV